MQTPFLSIPDDVIVISPMPPSNHVPIQADGKVQMVDDATATADDKIWTRNQFIIKTSFDNLYSIVIQDDNNNYSAPCDACVENPTKYLWKQQSGQA